jgi:predicted nucleic acid-binding protein
MIYFDTAYIVRLYFEDPGWSAVRSLAARARVACSMHGYAETLAALHRKHRDDTLSPGEYRATLEQFELDCREGAYHWLPLSEAVNKRVKAAYAKLPKGIWLRGSDALHLASALENQFSEIYSNDQRLLGAATHFGLRGLDVIDA